jgi:hypothetical protein
MYNMEAVKYFFNKRANAGWPAVSAGSKVTAKSLQIKKEVIDWLSI